MSRTLGTKPVKPALEKARISLFACDRDVRRHRRLESFPSLELPERFGGRICRPLQALRITLLDLGAKGAALAYSKRSLLSAHCAAASGNSPHFDFGETCGEQIILYLQGISVAERSLFHIARRIVGIEDANGLSNDLGDWVPFECIKGDNQVVPA